MFSFSDLPKAFAQFDLTVVEANSTLTDLEYQLRAILNGRVLLIPEELVRLRNKSLPKIQESISRIEHGLLDYQNYKYLPKFLKSWNQRKLQHKLFVIKNLVQNLEQAIAQ